MDQKTGSEIYEELYKSMLKAVADRAGHIAGIPPELEIVSVDTISEQNRHPVNGNGYSFHPGYSDQPAYPRSSFSAYNLSDKLDLVQKYLYERLPTVDIPELDAEIHRMEDYLGLDKKRLLLNKFNRALTRPSEVIRMLNPNAPDIGIVNKDNLKHFFSTYISTLDNSGMERKAVIFQLIRAYNNSMHEESVKRGTESVTRYHNPDLSLNNICLLTNRMMFGIFLLSGSEYHILNDYTFEADRFIHNYNLMLKYCKWSFLKDLVDREREFHILAYINDTAILAIKTHMISQFQTLPDYINNVAILAIKTHMISQFQTLPDYINNGFIDKETGKFIPGHTFEGIFKQWFGIPKVKTFWEPRLVRKNGSVKSRKEMLEFEILL